MRQNPDQVGANQNSKIYPKITLPTFYDQKISPKNHPRLIHESLTQRPDPSNAIN